MRSSRCELEPVSAGDLRHRNASSRVALGRDVVSQRTPLTGSGRLLPDKHRTMTATPWLRPVKRSPQDQSRSNVSRPTGDLDAARA